MATNDKTERTLSARLMARLRDYFFADVKLKLLALLVVLVIWFSVAGQTRQAAPITIQNVAVTLDSLPAQYAVTSTDPTEVSVTVQGPEDLLRELRIAVATRSSDMMAHADLSKLTEGVQLARLTVRGLPDGVSLKKIEPDSVRVTLDPIRTKVVAVEPRFAGTLPDGYKLTAATTEPQLVTLSGPQTILDTIDKVTTTTVSLNNRTASFDEPVDVDISTGDILVRDRVVLKVQIAEDQGTRKFTVPVTIEGGDGVTGAPTFEPATVTVTLKGPMPALLRITELDIVATISGSGNVNRTSVTPQITVSGPMAPRVEVESVSPAAVRVKK
ncbi:MAG: hypothetical protein IPF82_11880 [Blastocatellia bacterium]|nr:hypothetical protein [Blastocatellia bacterium]